MVVVLLIVLVIEGVAEEDELVMVVEMVVTYWS